MQEQVKKTSKKAEETSIDLSSLEKKKTEVLEQPSTRYVQLLYKSCCGCGCSDMTIKRKVKSDSPLKDGDRAEKLLPGDRQVD